MNGNGNAGEAKRERERERDSGVLVDFKVVLAIGSF